MSTLEGKVAFITGAGSGIGRGVAERMAREGADVCVVDVDVEGGEETASLVRERGRKAVVIKANVASEGQIHAASRDCVAGLGRLDVAVANAGIARGGFLLDMSVKDWQDQIDINLTGVFLTAQASAQRMAELGNGGRIVCISSLAALTTGARSWSYSATKVAVRMMVRGWAQELGSRGITVNAIGPGLIDTPLARPLAGEEGGAIRDSVETRVPAGRVGTPADIGGLVAFLSGPDAEYITGAYLLMDGGLRDARSADLDPDDPRAIEAQTLIAGAVARRRKQQPLLDDR